MTEADWNAGYAAALEVIQEQWDKISKDVFATCDSNPEVQKVTLKYRNLEDAQSAYTAMAAITKILQEGVVD